jgi:acyl carrier protein
MHHQRHFDRVRGLVSGQTGVPESEITLETRLYEDLGMDGDDGDEFLAAFADEFGLDIGGVAPLNYFNDESALSEYSMMIPAIAVVSRRFRAHARRCVRGVRALSVRNLVASAQARRWIRPQVARSDADVTRMTWWARLVLAGSAAGPALIGLRQYLSDGVTAGRAAEIATWTLLMLWVLLGAKFLLALRWLRRLDAAASFEEAANSER